MSVEKQLAAYGRLQEDMFGTIIPEEVTSLEATPVKVTPRSSAARRTVLVLAATLAVLTPIVGLSLLIDRPSDSVAFEPATMPNITWSEGSSKQLGELTPSRVATNGELYMAGQDHWAGAIWSSTDGITWEPAESDLLLVSGLSGGGFLAYRGHIDLAAIQYWRSDDGSNWTAVDPATDPLRLALFSWSGLSVDEVLGLDLFTAPSPDVQQAGAIFKVGDRYVAYYWSSAGTVEAAFSIDGRTWERVEVPGFLADWLDFSSPRAMSDRGFSQRLWSGTFSAGHGKVLAVTADAAGHHLWDSTDGVTWNEITSMLPPALDTPSTYGSHFLTAMDAGWTLAPWHRPFAPTGSETYYTLDGINWHTLSPQPNSGVPVAVLTVGNKVLFFTSNELHVARISPKP